MKIVCIIQALVMGGAERQLFGLAVQLKEKGHDVSVMTYRKGDFFRSYLEENHVPNWLRQWRHISVRNGSMPSFPL